MENVCIVNTTLRGGHMPIVHDIADSEKTCLGCILVTVLQSSCQRVDMKVLNKFIQ